jgi:hypothetical protein
LPVIVWYGGFDQHRRHVVSQVAASAFFGLAVMDLVVIRGKSIMD